MKTARSGFTPSKRLYDAINIDPDNLHWTTALNERTREMLKRMTQLSPTSFDSSQLQSQLQNPRPLPVKFKSRPESPCVEIFEGEVPSKPLQIRKYPFTRITATSKPKQAFIAAILPSSNYNPSNASNASNPLRHTASSLRNFRNASAITLQAEGTTKKANADLKDVAQMTTP